MRGSSVRGKVLLEVSNLSGAHKPEHVSFALHAGEVLGLAGFWVLTVFARAAARRYRSCCKRHDQHQGQGGLDP